MTNSEEMNISSEIFFLNGSNSSDVLYNDVAYEIFMNMNIICILLCLPPSLYVIWLIVTGTGLAAEIIILNVSVSEIFLCVQPLLVNLSLNVPLIVSLCIHGLLLISRPLFECLICVERYLAVVHPVTFLKFKPLRYRLMGSAVAWMAVLASAGVFVLFTIIWLSVLSLLFFFIQLFCCVAVLRALKQSGPGERGREEENHMKRRAFYIILITTVINVVMYCPYFILLFLITYGPSNAEVNAALNFGQLGFILSGLVQLIVFLYRVKKTIFIKCLKLCFLSN